MKKYTSVFGQMLQMISRYDFQKAVKQYDAEKHSKGFSSWNHFASLLFGQLAGQDALRGVEAGLASQEKKLYHLGIRSTKRSTLSYANKHRSHEVFQKVFETMLTKTATKAPGHKFRFKNDLYSFDATTVDLCLGLHDWAKFRKTKGGIKLHVKLNHSGYIPEFVTVTEAQHHEVNELPRLTLKAGDVIVFDRAFTDFNQFATYCTEGIYFVTRLKKNADYRVIERRAVSKYENISSDHIIEMNGYYTKKKCPVRLRRIRVKDPETGKYIVLLTNQFNWSPQTVAAVYKDRWQIEIFFKTMKQNLKIKSFLGTSKNAILSQIWVAMIAYLLLAYMKFISTYQWTINSLMKILPTLLFSRRDLWAWLNYPFGQPPPKPVKSLQLKLL
jgi:transposase